MRYFVLVSLIFLGMLIQPVPAYIPIDENVTINPIRELSHE